MTVRGPSRRLARSLSRQQCAEHAIPGAVPDKVVKPLVFRYVELSRADSLLLAEMRDGAKVMRHVIRSL